MGERGEAAPGRTYGGVLQSAPPHPAPPPRTWRGESNHARRWCDGEGKHNVSASASAPELAHDRRVVAVGVELLGRNEPHSATGGVLIGERDELALQRKGTDVPTCQAKGGLAGVRTCNAIVSTEVEETSGTSASTSNLARRKKCSSTMSTTWWGRRWGGGGGHLCETI